MTRRKLYILLKLVIVIMVVIPMITIGVEVIVNRSTKHKLFDKINDIPSNKVGLVLGTSKYLGNGHENLYYRYRIDAAVNLFNSGKIDYILISGDNGTKAYDEPSMMRKDLIKKGIPKDRIFSDYAGFRTLDSVVRSKEIFGQNQLTVISQQFHNERAIYIAHRKGIDAIGYNAKDVGSAYGFKTQIRERLARIKMMIDLLVKKKPKYLGPKIEIV